MVLVTQAYRFALDPTPRQRRALASHCGAARYAYNWGLKLIEQRLDQRAAGHEVEAPWTLSALSKEWNRAKEQVAPWWPENSKESYKSGLDALARGLANWADSKRGRRKGPRVGFPRRKTKHRARPSCRFTTGAIRVEPDRHHVVLPRIGRIRVHESTRKLARRLEVGTARILSATVSYTAERWYVSFTVEVQRRVRAPTQPQSVVGVDVGIRHLAVLSTGKVVPNPRALDRAQRQLRRLNRQLARRTPSAGWTQTRRRLARTHAQVANLRRDGLHKLTSELARRHGTIVVEQLNVGGMLRNRRLARRIADAGWGELRHQLSYKTTWAGSWWRPTPYYPSSKTCTIRHRRPARAAATRKPSYRCRSRPTGASAAGWCSTGTRTQPATSPPWSRRVRGWRRSPGVARRPETLGERT